MTPEALRLRAATPDDALALALVHQDSWLATYRDIFPQAAFDDLPLARREAIWRRTAQRTVEEPAARTSVVLAEAGGRVLGFASCGPFRVSADNLGDAGDKPRSNAPVGELYAMYLAPDVWRQGLGRALFGDCRRRLRDGGFAEMRLWVLAPNTPAIAFYEAMGGKRLAGSTFTTHGVTIDETCYQYLG